MTSSTEQKFRLPIIDFDRAKTDRQAVAEDVLHALENIGFLYIDNIKGIDYEKLMVSCKWLFDLPIEEKHAIMRKFWKDDNPNVYRGYFPVVKDKPSRKEGFEFARDVRPDDR